MTGARREAGQRGRSLVRIVLWPCRMLIQRFDQVDERRARKLREQLGRQQILVSWQRGPDGLWTARLSGPGLVTTLERSGPSRCRAIARTSLAMDRISVIRSKLREH